MQTGPSATTTRTVAAALACLAAIAAAEVRLELQGCLATVPHVSTSMAMFETDTVHYVDIGASYDFTDLFNGSLAGLTGRLGVINLTDEQPQIFPSSSQANTDPSAYDTLGRRYFVNLTYTFE